MATQFPWLKDKQNQPQKKPTGSARSALPLSQRYGGPLAGPTNLFASDNRSALGGQQGAIPEGRTPTPIAQQGGFQQTGQQPPISTPPINNPNINSMTTNGTQYAQGRTPTDPKLATQAALNAQNLTVQDTQGFVGQQAEGRTPTDMTGQGVQQGQGFVGQQGNGLVVQDNQGFQQSGQGIQQGGETGINDYLQNALDQLNKIQEGGKTAQDLAYQKQLDDLKATQQTEAQVLQQQLAQGRVTGAEARTAGLYGQRGREMALSEAEAQTGIAKAQQMQDATQQLGQLGLQQAQFEFAKEKYGDTEGQRLIDAINGGTSFAQIQTQFPDLNITEEDYNSIKAMYDINKEMGLLGLDAQTTANLMTDINSNMTYDQIKDKYPNVTQDQYEAMGMRNDLDLQFQQLGFSTAQSDDLYNKVSKGWTYDELLKEYPNISPAMFAQMQFTSPVGQIQYQQQADALNALVEAGGEGNLALAEDLFTKMFGTSIDFSNALAQDNSVLFNNGFNAMSGLASSGMGWDEALSVMQADGTMEALGMTSQDIASVYNNIQLQSNPVYQGQQFADQNVSSGLWTQDEADDYMAFITHSMTSPDGFSISDQHVVFDQSGNAVEAFDTDQQAQDYITSHPDQNLSSEFIENYIQDTPIGGDTGDTGSTKIEYEDFSANQIPSGEDWFDQQAWVDMGKPETWEEVEEAMKDNPIMQIYNDHDQEGIYNDQGNVQYTDEELKTIYRAIRDGDAFAMGKYGVAEGTSIDTFGDAIVNNSPLTENEALAALFGPARYFWNQKRDEYDIGKKNAHLIEMDEPLGITEADVNNNIGKMMSFTVDGEEQFMALQSYEEKVIAGKTYQVLIGVNPRTGKNVMYMIKAG